MNGRGSSIVPQVTPNDTSAPESGPFGRPGTVPSNPSEPCQSTCPLRLPLSLCASGMPIAFRVATRDAREVRRGREVVTAGKLSQIGYSTIRELLVAIAGVDKSRSTRSGAGRASRSRLVVHARPRREIPSIPALRMSRAWTRTYSWRRISRRGSRRSIATRDHPIPGVSRSAVLLRTTAIAFIRDRLPPILTVGQIN